MRFGLCNLPLVHILVEIYGNHKTTVSTIKDNPPKERLAKLRQNILKQGTFEEYL